MTIKTIIRYLSAWAWKDAQGIAGFADAINKEWAHAKKRMEDVYRDGHPKSIMCARSSTEAICQIRNLAKRHFPESIKDD